MLRKDVLSTHRSPQHDMSEHVVIFATVFARSCWYHNPCERPASGFNFRLHGVQEPASAFARVDRQQGGVELAPKTLTGPTPSVRVCLQRRPTAEWVGMFLDSHSRGSNSTGLLELPLRWARGQRRADESAAASGRELLPKTAPHKLRPLTSICNTGDSGTTSWTLWVCWILGSVAKPGQRLNCLLSPPLRFHVL